MPEAACPDSRNWLLTGIPRAGTSLCCRLAGQLSNTVALSEPIKGNIFADTEDPAVACMRISRFMAQTRQRILAEGRAESVHVQGHLDDNMVAATALDAGLRRQRTQHGDIRIDKPLTPDFTLLVKHNALFAALLPRLTPRFACIGVVRNPVAALASWQTVNLPVHQGRVPVGERFAPDLGAALADQSDVLQRQIIVLNWFFRQYERHLPPPRIVRYEDVATTSGAALYRALGNQSSEQPGEILASRNANAAYGGNAEHLLTALQRDDGAWRRFYTLEDCERTALAIRNSGDRARGA